MILIFQQSARNLACYQRFIIVQWCGLKKPLFSAEANDRQYTTISGTSSLVKTAIGFEKVVKLMWHEHRSGPSLYWCSSVTDEIGPIFWKRRLSCYFKRVQFSESLSKYRWRDGTVSTQLVLTEFLTCLSYNSWRKTLFWKSEPISSVLARCVC